jgi:engulfment/cell motility protein 1
MSAVGTSSSSRLSGLPTGTSKAPPLVPTNHVTTLEGVTVRARIDPNLTVDDVLKQLCSSLKKEPASDYALRDDSDELVTNDNLRKKIRGRVGLK